VRECAWPAKADAWLTKVFYTHNRRDEMNILTPGIRLLRVTKETLVAVNRTIMSLDPVYVSVTWAGSAISSLRQLGVYTLFGGLVGHVVEKVTVDWIAVAVGISIYLIYRFAETAATAILALRKRRFELVLSDQLEERMLAKLTSLDLGRLLDPSFIELQRMARHRGLWAVAELWQKQRELVGSGAARLAAIPAGASPANRGVQSLL
jgi:hypothetical protein